MSRDLIARLAQGVNNTDVYESWLFFCGQILPATTKLFLSHGTFQPKHRRHHNLRILVYLLFRSSLTFYRKFSIYRLMGLSGQAFKLIAGVLSSS